MATPDIHIYIHSPVAIFKARTNMAGAITYPVTELTFDGVTVGAFGDIAIDSTLLLGTTEGGDDLGRVRVQGAATSTTIPVGRISEGVHDGELAVADNAYITVWDDFRVWSKIPYIDDDGVQYKDADLAVGDLTEDIPPVAVMRQGAARTIDSITELITVSFTGIDSYAMADGATISTYLWDVDDGTLTVGTTASATITATFPAGFRYVSLTVTDSNGKTHITRRPVYARDPADDTSLPGTYFQISSHTVTPEGQTIDLRALRDIPETTYVDGCLILVWDGEPTDTGFRDNITFIGWIQSDSNEARGTRTGLLRDTVLHCVDVAGRLKTLPGFSQTVTIPEGVSVVNWNEMVAPTMDKYMHYILHWHSTTLGVTDFYPSNTGDDYPFVLFSSQGENLWQQVQNEAKALVPGHILTCNRTGQLHVNVEPLLQDLADRIASVLAIFDESNTESIQFDYTRPPRVHWIRGHALLTATDYTEIDGTDTLLTVECIAPGTAPGQGVSELEFPEGLAQTQEALNSAIGHLYARLNNPMGLIRVVTTGDEDHLEIDPANPGWVDLTVTSATAPQRGRTFTLLRTRCKEISFRYDHTRTGLVRRAEFLLEPETIGRPALTQYPEGAPVPPATIPPPDFGLIDGQQLVAGIGLTELYRTADFQTVSGSGGPTWTAHTLTTEDILSWVVDPFSPGYLTGTGAINGWVVTATDIYRITDIFGSVACTSIHTFAVAQSGATEWRTIQSSFGTYFVEGLNPWLMVVSHYADSAGHTGTWALRSTNGGTSWFPEVQISEHYDDGASTDARPVAVYLSPKTPGLAYATAFITTDDPPQASGFVSTDWGATWTQMVSDFVEDPAEPLPRWALWHVDPVASGLEVKNLGGSFSAMVHAEEDGLVVGTAENELYVILAPPKDAARVLVNCTYSTVREMNGGSSSTSGSLGSIGDGSNQTHTDDLTFTQPGTPDGTSAGSFTIEWTKTNLADWNINAESIISSPPMTVSGAKIRLDATANASGTLPYALYQLRLNCVIAEIELENGHIYTPPEAVGVIDPNHRLGGDMHVPWILNDSEGLIYHGYADMTTTRQFRLKRVNVDDTISDVSPSDSGINYGVNAYGFRIRAYDSDRTYMLASVTGNDVSASDADDQQAVYVSIDEGDTWTEVVAPATGTEPYGAAFAGDTEQVIFLFGPAGYFGYSSNFGVAVDSRAGNLSALSAEPLCGICGGPTP